MLTDEILTALVAVYIVDVSGFTEAWRTGLSRLLGVKHLRALPPFDCGTCAAFWSAIVWSICVGKFSLEAVAVAAVCSLLALPAGQFMQLIKEWACSLIGKAFPKQ